MNEMMRQGMVKSVTVREYGDEPKFLRVVVKSPTELPVAQWSSGGDERKVDDIEFSMPLDSGIRVGDLVAMHFIFDAPLNETQRFRPALEVSVEDRMIAEAKEDQS